MRFVAAVSALVLWAFSPNNTFGQAPPGLYYVHVDHLSTPRAIYNDQQQLVWRWDHQEPFGNSPPNENPSGIGAFECNLRFPGQYFDKETNLAYNYFRDFDPALGRYVQSDPNGIEGGPSVYAYVGGNPIWGIDPFGLDTLVAKGGMLSHYDSKGNLVGRYPYTSGVGGVTDPSVQEKGPIPPGRYTVDPSDISPAGFMRRYLDPRDWGEYRVTMMPHEGTNTFGRSGFFIHGGKRPGSKGCIDIGDKDKDFFPRLRRVKEPVEVIVVPPEFSCGKCP